MIEQEQINRFNIAVQNFLENGSIDVDAVCVEDQGMLELAQALAVHDTRVFSGVEKSLKQRLLNRVNVKTARPMPAYASAQPLRSRRFLLVLPTLAVFFLLAVFSVPPLRAFAEDIIHRIGNYILSNEPTSTENYVATLQSGTPTATVDPSRICTNCQQVFEVGTLSIAEVSEKAGFPVYEAMYIPEGYWLSSRDSLVTDSTTTVDSSYRMELDPPLHDGLQMAGIIALEQTQLHDNAQPWEEGVGDVPIVEVSVRGQPGVWLEQIPVIPFQDQQGEWDYERWNQLIWVEDGYNFMLQTNMPADILPLSELLKITDSLKK
jgi:hypothetical protein